MTNQLRQQLALPQTSITLSFLGFIAGLLAAGIIVLFRFCIDTLQLWLAGHQDDFTQVSSLDRILFPVSAAIIIAVLGVATKFKYHRMGVPMVIHWMKMHYGKVPFKTTLNQFFGGVIALGSGFSVGREGPAVHLGAAVSSFFGYFNLPLNAAKTLSACGIAAAISASFNTPLAAVLFVMEVILREYKIHVFIPIIIASVTGSVVTLLIFGDVTEFGNLKFAEFALIDMPFLLILGIVVGLFSVCFKKNLIYIMRESQHIRMWPRLLLAGVITGLIGFLVPESMGPGLAAVNSILSNPSNLQLLIGILVAKWIATHFALGLGIPGGVIGPLIGLGSLIGAIYAFFPAWFLQSEPLTGSYVVLSMAGLMAATLHAPLAAMITVMELTNSPSITLDGMLVIAIAYITSRKLFYSGSLFIMQLDLQKLPYSVPPVIEALQKVGVLAEMQDKLEILVNPEEAQVKQALSRNLGSDIAVVVKRQHDTKTEYLLAEYSLAMERNDNTPIHYFQMEAVAPNATLAEAYELLRAKRNGAVYINNNDESNITGIVTWVRIRHNFEEGNAVL